MTRKAQTLTILLSTISLSALVLLTLVARAWLNAGPIVDMRL